MGGRLEVGKGWEGHDTGWVFQGKGKLWVGLRVSRRAKGGEKEEGLRVGIMGKG